MSMVSSCVCCPWCLWCQLRGCPVIYVKVAPNHIKHYRHHGQHVPGNSFDHALASSTCTEVQVCACNHKYQHCPKYHQHCPKYHQHCPKYFKVDWCGCPWCQWCMIANCSMHNITIYNNNIIISVTTPQTPKTIWTAHAPAKF